MMVCIHTATNLPSCLYTFYKANMLLLYYMTLSILEFSMTFSISCNYMNYDRYHV